MVGSILRNRSDSFNLHPFHRSRSQRVGIHGGNSERLASSDLSRLTQTQLLQICLPVLLSGRPVQGGGHIP